MGLLLRKLNADWIVQVREEWLLPLADWNILVKQLAFYGMTPSVNVDEVSVLVKFDNSTAKGSFKAMMVLFNDLAVLKEKYGKGVKYGKNDK